MLAAARPSPAQLAGDARAIAGALGAQLLCCLAITLVVAMLLPSGHHGGLVDWLRGMVVLGGAAQRGAVTANVSASVLALSGQASASLTAPPLLLTAVLVGLLALLTVRSERSNPSAAWPVAVGRIVLGAAGYALVWALLGVLVRGQIGFGTADALGEVGQADVGVGFWSMLGHRPADRAAGRRRGAAAAPEPHLLVERAARRCPAHADREPRR